MPRNIILAASLPATPERLFDMYLSPQLHAAFCGAPVTIEPRAGAPFRAFEGMISGTILHVEPKRLIVQSWRSAKWPLGSIDSVLVLTFLPDASLPNSTGPDATTSVSTGGRIELVHINVADEDFAGVSHGWEKYYWTPWRAYLEAERAT